MFEPVPFVSDSYMMVAVLLLRQLRAHSALSFMGEHGMRHRMKPRELIGAGEELCDLEKPGL